MKNIVIICPLPRDRREIPNLEKRKEYNFIYVEHRGKERAKLSGEPLEKDCAQMVEIEPSLHYQKIIDRIIHAIKNTKVEGIISSGDYPGCLMASVVAQKLKLLGPDIHVLLKLQHKLISRTMQKQIVPEATPNFSLIEDASSYRGSFPIFVKPVKSNFSQSAGIVHNQEDLIDYLQLQKMPESYLEVFVEFLADYSEFFINTSHFIGEDVLRGHQVSVEGIVVDGDVSILGIVDAHMYPGTFSFKRFEYPSSLEESVQQDIAAIARKVISFSGLDNACFNIEFMYDPVENKCMIIEINPRMVSQFSDIFFKVDGYNLYQVLIDIALGKLPEILRREGQHPIAASYVLRVFNDAFVSRVPKHNEIMRLQKKFPGATIEICCREGKRLSDDLQDGKSFRYALINLGAKNRQELLSKCKEIEQLLQTCFQFES